MKRLTLLAMLTTPALAHQVTPETKFFRDEFARNPLTSQVLAYCGLVGLDEVACRDAMYDGNTISDTKIKAAEKCVNDSGLKYRVAFDKVFQKNAKKQNLVSHEAGGAIWHLHYVADPAEGPNAKPHKHGYTDVDMLDAGRLKGDEFVERLKRDWAGNTTTETSSLSGTGTVGASGLIVTGEGSVTKGSETSVTKTPLTDEQIAAARAQGEAYGRAHPETTNVKPHMLCYQDGDCMTPGKAFANPDNAKREGVAGGSTDPKPAEAPKEPKPAQPTPEPKTEDPFAPFLGDSEPKPAPNSDKKDVVSTPASIPSSV